MPAEESLKLPYDNTAVLVAPFYVAHYLYVIIAAIAKPKVQMISYYPTSVRNLERILSFF